MGVTSQFMKDGDATSTYISLNYLIE